MQNQNQSLPDATIDLTTTKEEISASTAPEHVRGGRRRFRDLQLLQPRATVRARERGGERENMGAGEHEGEGEGEGEGERKEAADF